MVCLPQTSWTFGRQVINIDFKLKYSPDLLDSTLASRENWEVWLELQGPAWPTKSYMWQVLKILGIILICPPWQQGDERELNNHLTGRRLVSEIPFCAQHLYGSDYLVSVDLSDLLQSSSVWHGLAHLQGMGLSREILVSLIYSRVTYGLAWCCFLFLPAHPDILILIALFRSWLLLL